MLSVVINWFSGRRSLSFMYLLDVCSPNLVQTSVQTCTWYKHRSDIFPGHLSILYSILYSNYKYTSIRITGPAFESTIQAITFPGYILGIMLFYHLNIIQSFVTTKYIQKKEKFGIILLNSSTTHAKLVKESVKFDVIIWDQSA